VKLYKTANKGNLLTYLFIVVNFFTVKYTFYAPC